MSYTRRKSSAAFTPPMGIRMLPFNLLRDSLVTRRPDIVQEAVGEYVRYMNGEQKPLMMPQKLAFQQWKTDPDGHRRPWWASAASVNELFNSFSHGVPNTVARKLPRPMTYAELIAARARGADILPQPDTEFTRPVVNRAVRPDTPTSSFEGRWEPPPEAVMQAHRVMHDRRRTEQQSRMSTALQEVASVITRTRSLVGR